MAIAKAVAPDNQLIYGIVIFLFDLSPWVQQVITQSVQLGEVQTEISDLQLVCDMKTLGLVKYNGP